MKPVTYAKDKGRVPVVAGAFGGADLSPPNYTSMNLGSSLIGLCQLLDARSVPWEVQG